MEGEEDAYTGLTVPRGLVKFVAAVTGFPEETVRKVLEAERLYYMQYFSEGTP